MRRSILALVLGAAFGYWYGYSDAFRGDRTIGARVAIAIGRMHPDEISKERTKEAQKLQEHVRSQSGVHDSIIP